LNIPGNGIARVNPGISLVGKNQVVGVVRINSCDVNWVVRHVDFYLLVRENGRLVMGRIVHQSGKADA
jgi:hypothetical protein